MIAYSDEFVTLQTLITDNECNSAISNEHFEQENCSNEIAETEEIVQNPLLTSNDDYANDNNSIDKENISFYKYRKIKMAERIKKQIENM